VFRAQLCRQPKMRLPLTPVVLAFVVFGSLLADAMVLATVYAIVVLAIRADLTQQGTLLSRTNVGRWSDLTYSIYMLHIPVATVVLTIMGRAVSAFVPNAKLMLVPIALGVLAVASHLTYRYFETPIRHYLYDLLDRRRNAGLSISAAARGEGR
jgi:peptidoglycan/LPS O-acetylase OafA/YrhL